MGYYASGSGLLYLKRDASDKYKTLSANLEINLHDPLQILVKLVDKAESFYGLSIDIQCDNSHPDCYCLDIVHEYSKYYEEDIYEFLDLIKPLLVSVDHHTGIYFFGDDDECWRFTVPMDGEYTKTFGEVVFDGQECSQRECAFWNNGVCHCHKVHGRYPKWMDEQCNEYVFAEKDKA